MTCSTSEIREFFTFFLENLDKSWTSWLPSFYNHDIRDYFWLTIQSKLVLYFLELFATSSPNCLFYLILLQPCLPSVMDLLCASFKHIQKEDANTHYTGLIQKIFKKGFDCRTLFIGDSDLMTDMEEMSIKAFSSLVLKLSENSFRPLYLEVSCLILITATHCHTCDNQHMNIGGIAYHFRKLY